MLKPEETFGIVEPEDEHFIEDDVGEDDGEDDEPEPDKIETIENENAGSKLIFLYLELFNLEQKSERRLNNITLVEMWDSMIKTTK